MVLEKIAVLLMVKNEEDNIAITLDSVRQFPFVLVYDTGSTDNTIKIANTYDNVIIFKGEFVDFSTSRNNMLKIAEGELEQSEYFLLMDAGDQFILDGTLTLTGACGYMVPQVWYSGTTNRYYNLRLIKKEKNFRYKGRVHEYIEVPGNSVIEKMDSFHLFQDRTKTGSSSAKRWRSDIRLLKKEIMEDPSSARYVFYLAQTYDCLKMKEKAYNMYEKRANMSGGFEEERFVAMVKCGDSAPTWSKSIAWYINAFNLLTRAEPLVKIAEYYKDTKNYYKSWLFLKMACELEYPTNCIFFVDKDIYAYKRWHLLGIVSYYIGKMEDGKKGCEMAIAAKDLQLDKDNLYFYQAPTEIL